MTEKKEVKKPVRKPVAKKVEEKAVKVVETVEETVPQKRTKRAEIDRNEMIPCRSATDGKLLYISDRTRARFVWANFGVTQYVEMGELLDMRASHPKFLDDVRLIVEDEDAVEYLGLTAKYESLDGFDDLDKFFDKTADELAEMVPKLPKGIKDSLASRARKLIEQGTLDSNNKIRILEESLKVDLKLFEK